MTRVIFLCVIVVSLVIGLALGNASYQDKRNRELVDYHCKATAYDNRNLVYVCDGGKIVTR